jgi:hypothetical protein
MNYGAHKEVFYDMYQWCVAGGGIGYLYSGHVRDIPVHSSSVPDR